MHGTVGDRAPLIQPADLKRWFFRIKSRGQSVLRIPRDCPPPTLSTVFTFQPFDRMHLCRSIASNWLTDIQTCKLRILNAIFRLKSSRISIKLEPIFGPKKKISLLREGIEMRRCYRPYTRERHFFYFFFFFLGRGKKGRIVDGVHVTVLEFDSRFQIPSRLLISARILICVCIRKQRDLQTRLHLRKHHCQY